ncbi:MAG: response regulator [Anaerolineae bacterium]|nr:response regulator [Anaerolineae bacterium]
MASSTAPPFQDTDSLRLASLHTNLEDLRKQLTLRLALLLIATAQIIILFYDSPVAFPVGMVAFWFLLTALSLTVLWLRSDHHSLARHLLVWGTVAETIFAMWLFPDSWIPYVGVVLVFSNSLIVKWSEVTTAVLIFLAAFLLQTYSPGHQYDIAPLFSILVLAVAIAALAVRTLYTTLDWVWQMNEQSKELLMTTRNQQAELRSLVKSLRIVNDIRERTEQELMVAHKEAQKARQLKEQFAANISHELRTPLSIILGFSEVMYLSPEVYGPQPLPPTLMRDVAQIYRNSRHLLDMIDDILDLSRFEMVGFTLKKEPTQLAALINEATTIVGNLFEKSEDVALVVDIAPNLPLIDIDQTRIRQVLLNLLNNAHRFTERGTVTLTATQVGNDILVQVRDTGPGISDEDATAIFTEFYQVDYSLSRSHGGAGLGLAICQRFVDAHDGRIWVESVAGVGSTFSFTLPLDLSLVDHTHLYRSPIPDPKTKEIRPCLLLVESDLQVSSLVARHLDGYEVVVVENSEDVAEQAELRHPLAILLNVQPGQQANTAVLATVAAPVIECSLPSQAWMATSLGAMASLTKPINFEKLNEYLSRLEGVQNILVIDDNPGVCQLVRRRLEGEYTMQIAYEGRTGLNIMQQQPPDLVILDLMMPEMDGFAVIEAMQVDPTLASVPVILLTATTYIEDTLAQYGNQVKIVQATPWHPAETLRFLKSVLAGLRPMPKTDNI